MSFLPIAVLVPVQEILPAAEAFADVVAPVVRPLFGLGMIIAILTFFKPLLKGLLRAVLLALKSRQAMWARRKLRDVMTLNRMARDFDATQPNLAAELRILARRD